MRLEVLGPAHEVHRARRRRRRRWRRGLSRTERAGGGTGTTGLLCLPAEDHLGRRQGQFAPDGGVLVGDAKTAALPAEEVLELVPGVVVVPHDLRLMPGRLVDHVVAPRAPQHVLLPRRLRVVAGGTGGREPRELLTGLSLALSLLPPGGALLTLLALLLLPTAGLRAGAAWRRGIDSPGASLAGAPLAAGLLVPTLTKIPFTRRLRRGGGRGTVRGRPRWWRAVRAIRDRRPRACVAVSRTASTRRCASPGRPGGGLRGGG